MGSAAEHGAVPQPAGLCLGWRMAGGPQGWLFPRQQHRAARMRCSLQPGVNGTAATAIVPSLPLVISPLRRWGDHFQAYGAIPGTVERRQILHDKLPPGAGQHSLPALHRYHAHCFAKGGRHLHFHIRAVSNSRPCVFNPSLQQEVGICSVPPGCGARWRERFSHPSKGGGEHLSHNILILKHRAHSSQS